MTQKLSKAGLEAAISAYIKSALGNGTEDKDDITAAITAYKEHEWLPISEAPKDVPLFATNPKRRQMGVVFWNGSDWESLSIYGTCVGTGFYPTHFMHLPTPPKEK